MSVLGLDLSTRTGYALIGDDGSLVVYDKIEHGTDELFPMEEYRYMHIAELIAKDVCSVVDKYKPSAIIIEQTNLGSKRESQKYLEFIHYAVLQALRDKPFGGYMAYVDTSAWRRGLGIKLSKEQRLHNKTLNAQNRKNRIAGKKSHSGKGQGKVTWKHLSVNYVNQKFNLDLLLAQNDIADAICLGLFGLKQSLQNTNRSDTIDFDISIFSK
jgi:Holliday junction resolvasome RuvABC endonuclease subunit